jgi:hypothetical protein
MSATDNLLEIIERSARDIETAAQQPGADLGVLRQILLSLDGMINAYGIVTDQMMVDRMLGRTILDIRVKIPTKVRWAVIYARVAVSELSDRIEEEAARAARFQDTPTVIIGGVDYTGVPKDELFAHLKGVLAEQRQG